MSGYNVVLGQVGWNISLNQQISFLRGAAQVQGKDWGVIITWKYQQAPYLDSGKSILSQLRTAYECGSKYFVLFNYYPTDDNSYGTMQDEHFRALESFWKDVVNNRNVLQGSIKADSGIVFPQNYGYAGRWMEDKIWGIFKADNQTTQIWNLMQSTLNKHELQTDIVYAYDDFPLASEYQNLYLWNSRD